MSETGILFIWIVIFSLIGSGGSLSHRSPFPERGEKISRTYVPMIKARKAIKEYPQRIIDVTIEGIISIKPFYIVEGRI